jgi:long-chain acyl-CoA synthetase
MKGNYPEYPTDPIPDIRAMFLRSSDRFADKPALQYKKSDRWIPISYRELRENVEQVACGLVALGLAPAETKLAIVGENRPEWAITFLAAACTGIICVPIDRDLRETEVYHILYLSGAQAAVTDAKHLEMLQDIAKKLPKLTTLICMDEPGEGGIGFEQLKEMGRKEIAAGQNSFAEGQVSGESLLSILFTSGTMGNSKGVMLTHGNVASNICDAQRWVHLRSDDRFLSVLPLHHCYECTHGFLLPLSAGALISYAENLRRIVENIAETKTTGVLGVPLLWHTLYKKIEAGMAEKGMWKVRAAKRFASICKGAIGVDLRSRLFAGVHRRFGGALRILISGGAAIDPEVARGFRELGISFLQGYGLTESAPLIAANRDRAFKDNAAGLPLPSVEVKIAEDGEILARGPNIMKGYYNNPEATAAALQDGWLHTGDLGRLDADGFLFVQGRKKSVIVTPGGKKVYPEEVEAEILKSPFVLECLVWGSESDDPTSHVEVQAIVVPNAEYFISQGLEQNGSMDSSVVESILRREVKARCLNLAPFKRVTRLTIRFEEFEKTTTRKIKRYLYTGKPADLNVQAEPDAGLPGIKDASAK